MANKPEGKVKRSKVPRRKAEGPKASSRAWAAGELAQVKQVDTRSRARLHEVLAGQHSSPGASIPEAMGSWAQAKGAYRLACSGVFTDQDLLESHRLATVGRIQSAGPREVLVIQDTTSLNFSGRPGTTGLGPIGNNADKTMGLFAHSQLCVDACSGRSFGLVAAKIWAREPGLFGKAAAGARNRQPLQEKESHRWLEGWQHAQQLARQLGPAVAVTSVADREGDLYEVFMHARQAAAQGGPAAHLLIRAQHNRVLTEGEKRSHEQVRSGPVRTTLTLKLPGKPGRKEREAILDVRFERIQLAVPADRRKYQGHTEPLTLSLIVASEREAPPGEEPVEWLLWSSRPVETGEDAAMQLRFYARRWQIEVMHRILKTGCKAEERQLETAGRLKLFLAMDLMIAVYLLGLTHAARLEPEAPATGWFDPEELHALQLFVEKTMPVESPTLRTATRWLGQLGGHLGRKSDGPAGPQVLWRGLIRLRDLTSAWLAFSSLHNISTCG